MSVYSLKVYSVLVFSTFTVLRSDYHHLITEHFHQPKTDPTPPSSITLSPGNH